MKMENKQKKNIENFVEGEYLITIDPDYVGKENIDNKLKTINGINIIKKFSLKEIYHVKIESPKEIVEEDKKSDYISTKIEELKGLEYILYVEPVGKVQASNEEQDFKPNQS